MNNLLSLDDIIKSKLRNIREKQRSNHFSTREAAYGRQPNKSVWRREDGTSQPCKLFVSNLDVGVSECDLKLLFGDYGKLAKVALNYDRFGHSQGTAVIVFVRRNDALMAMAEYDGVPLDNLQMKIELATSEVTLPKQRNYKARVGLWDGSFNINRAVGRRNAAKPQYGWGGNARGAVHFKKRYPKLTVEGLNADLDEYNRSKMPKKNKIAQPTAVGAPKRKGDHIISYL